MIIGLILAALMGGLAVETKHYQACKAEDFKPEICSFEKKLSKLEQK
jgi:hypothetical protein